MKPKLRKVQYRNQCYLVVIPKPMAEEIGIEKGTMVECSLKGDAIQIRKAKEEIEV